MKFCKYDESYISLLEKYFYHPATPDNNTSHKKFKTHLYNDIDGVCGFLVDNDEIVAISSAMVVKENNIVSCKYPHRFHVRQDYVNIKNRFLDQHWEPFLFSWLENKNIDNLYFTVNVGNEVALLWSIKNTRRRNHVNYINETGKKTAADNWYVLPYVTEEMYTWQYVVYKNTWVYSHRAKQPINEKVTEYLNKNFNYVENYGWII